MTELFITAFINIRIWDVIDILLVALLLYQLYALLKGTAAINIFLGIVAIILLWQLVKALEMELLTAILGAFISVGFIALIVVFQPEIRRFLLLLGTASVFSKYRKRFLFWKINQQSEHRLDVDKIVKACQKMGQSYTGALIAITKRSELRLYEESGEVLDARLSDVLLEDIFYKNSPLHDGAVLIKDNRIYAARCVLPITKNENFPQDYGLRHRAAVGLSEVTDAIAIVVSEQTGKLAYAKAGELYRDVSPSLLKDFLEEEYNA